MAKNKNEENYTTRRAAEGIVEEKSKWQAASDKGDQEGMDKAAENAKKYYTALTDSGNYDAAKNFSSMGYDAAKKYLDTFREPTKTTDDMIKEQQQNNMNAQNGFYNFVDDAGERINDARDKQGERVDTNPYTTEAAKSIFERYEGLGNDAAENAYASGSARSDGNMDSFSQANGARQRLEYEKAGAESALDYYDKWVDKGETQTKGVRDDQNAIYDMRRGAIASGLDVAESMTNNRNSMQTADDARNKANAEITGKVPLDVQRRNNVFFDSDGNLLDPTLDFMAIKNAAEARGDTEMARMANEARNYKIQTQPEYRQYSPTMEYGEAPQTESAREFDVNAQLAREKQEAENMYNNAMLEYQQRALDSETQNAGDENTLKALQIASNAMAAGQYSLATQIMQLYGFDGSAAGAATGGTGSYTTSGAGGAAASNETGAAAASGSGTGSGTGEQGTQASVDKFDTIKFIRETAKDQDEKKEMYAAAGITPEDVDAYNKSFWK